MIALAGALVWGGPAGMAGCAMMGGTRRSDNALNAAGASTSSEDTETNEFAEQARRDIEQLQHLQQQRGAADAGQLADGSIQSPTGPPRIDWLTPDSSSTSRASATGTVQEPLAGDPPASDLGTANLPLPMPTELPGGSVMPDQEPQIAETDPLGRLIVELSAELYRRGA